MTQNICVYRISIKNGHSNFNDDSVRNTVKFTFKVGRFHAFMQKMSVFWCNLPHKDVIIAKN